MKFFFALVVCAIAVAVNCQTEDNDWKEYKKKHGKDYKETVDGGKEDQARKARFLAKDAKIKKHNSGNPTFLQAHNHFSDMTDDELAQHLGVKKTPSSFLRSMTSVQLEDRALPTSLDYRNNACLPAVKNQGSCGSCWAFSATAPLEFSYCKKYNTSLVMSEQHLVDCDTNDGGCNGGWYTNAWSYLQKTNGSAKQSLYAYTGTKSTTCKFTTSMMAAKVSSFGYASTTKNITEIQSALDMYGPLAIAITVVDSFYSYSSGVYTDATCDGQSVNHGVVLVGWGVLNNVNYWIIRNSWGTGWGLSGYALIQRGVNKCNIESSPAYVVAA